MAYHFPAPNIGFANVLAQDDTLLDRAIEGVALFAFSQGAACTCPRRVLIQESVYDRFTERALKRVAAIERGSPLDTATVMGAQASGDAGGHDHVLPRSRQAAGAKQDTMSTVWHIGVAGGHPPSGAPWRAALRSCAVARYCDWRRQ